jgi:hypothetical protein
MTSAGCGENSGSRSCVDDRHAAPTVYLGPDNALMPSPSEPYVDKDGVIAGLVITDKVPRPRAAAELGLALIRRINEPQIDQLLRDGDFMEICLGDEA